MIKSPFTTSTPIKPTAAAEGDQEQDAVSIQPEKRNSLVLLGETNQTAQMLSGNWMRYFNGQNNDNKQPPYDVLIKEQNSDAKEDSSVSEIQNLTQLLTGRTSFKLNEDYDRDGDRSSFQMAFNQMSNSMPSPKLNVDGLFGKELEMCQQADPNSPRAKSQRTLKSKESAERSVPDNNATFLTSHPPADGDYSEYDSQSLSFKRKYQPTVREFKKEHDKQPIEEVFQPIQAGAASQIYESRVDKILRIMNTSDSDYSRHRIRVSQKPALQSPISDRLSKTNSYNQNYSFYALFFMIASNVVGLLLSLSYQVLLFFKVNADRFLNNSWSHWQNATVLQRENNIMTLIIMLPVILLVLMAYVSIWLAYNLNRLMLTSVPDRLADAINFNIHIVQ